MDDDLLNKHDADLQSLGLDVASMTSTSENKLMDELDTDVVSARSGSLSSDDQREFFNESTTPAITQTYVVTSSEPEAIRLWKQETKERIEKQHRDAEEKNKVIREQALKDIEEFKKARLTRINDTFSAIEATKNTNNATHSDMLSSKVWSNAVTTSKLSTRPPYCLKDVTRMRKVLVSLKEQQDVTTADLI